MQQANTFLIDKFGCPPWMQKLYPKKKAAEKLASEILLGYGGEVINDKVVYDFTDPVYIDVPKKSENLPNILLMGGKGCLLPKQRICTFDGLKRIKDLKSQDIVYSYNFNLNKVEKDFATKMKPVIKKEVLITLENGDEIICSPEHRWFTRDGLKETKDLTKDDYLVKV